ncbi:MAG: helix-turn-helix transcriptional regulator [Clostridia bacterium]|nr:helix-turn-helix transcriptional regulator [Clostridia bacterium]MBQ1966487.1 helix-turn-helix transcriptional regulator [Clostridia bacterium]
MNEYCNILKALREDRDLSQKEIAEYLGTTQQVYSRYETGINEIPVRQIIKLCKLYGVSADYILGIK